MPRPSSPPSAKASTRRPSLAQTIQVHHAQEQPTPPPCHARASHRGPSSSRHTDPFTQHSLLTPLTTAACPRAAFAGRVRQTLARTRHGLPTGPAPPGRHCDRSGGPPSCPAHPGAHQNLIHTCQRPSRGARRRPVPAPTGTEPLPLHDNSGDPRPIIRPTLTRVEADGIEPTTPCLQSRCSPS